MPKFTLPITVELHEKLKEYSRDNGITMIGAIRFILMQFFKQKQN